MRKRFSSPCGILLIFLVTFPLLTITFVNGQVPENHESWDMEISDMLNYIEQSWNPVTSDFDWLYPKDEEKYQLFFQTSKTVDLIRDQNKDTNILNSILDPQLAASTLISLLEVWDMQYSVNTESMFGVLAFLKMASDGEVTTMVSSFESHLTDVSLKIGESQAEFKSVTEVKSFVEARSFGETLHSVDWEEVSNVMQIKLKVGETSPFAILISVWDCLDAMYNHWVISEEIDALPLPSLDDTDKNVVQEIKEHEVQKVEFGGLVTDFAEIVGKFIGSEIGKSIGLSVGAAMGASFAAAFPPAPVVGAAVGYLAGGYFGGELLGRAAGAAAEILTNELVGEPLLKQLHELGIPTISAGITEVYSEGHDYDVSSKEKVYVTVQNNDPVGTPERELIVSVNPSLWEVIDYWGTLELERWDFDNTKTVKLDPGESETIWFTVIPDGFHVDEELTFVLWHREGWLWWAKEAIINTHTRTFHSGFAFVPMDLILILDRSGSMSGSKIIAARNSAIAVVDSLMSVDRVAVVSFSSSASVNVHLTGDFEYAKTQIQRISAGGMTSFGAGLSLALNELKTMGSEEHAWVMIFMSDGKHNTFPHPNQYVAECKNLKIPIYTIGLGDVSESLLRWMASETGGKYLYAPSLYELQNIFLRFSLEATGWIPEGEFSGMVYEGQTVVAGTFNVAPITAFVRVTMNWPGSDLDMILVRPDGNEVDFFWDLDVVYSGASTKPEWVIILAPQEGTWTVKVYGKTINSPDEPFVIWVSTYTPPVPHDTTPPTTSLDIGSPRYTDALDNIYIRSSTTLTLDAIDNTDTGSGVAITGYRYDGEWIEDVPPVSFHIEGPDRAYHIEYNSTDNAGNVELTQHSTLILDNTGPLIAVSNPPAGWALQDGVTFMGSIVDSGSGVFSMSFSIREANDGGGTPIGYEDLPVSYDSNTGEWSFSFDTLLVPDGYYVLYIEAEDNLGNEASTTVPYSIRNWAVIELLPASEDNKAGRTMPVKFALRVAAEVDPDQPFVYNEELRIEIFATADPDNILQESYYGDTSRDYRTSSVLYVTNFRTTKRKPMEYTVAIYRDTFDVGSFTFETVK